MRLLIVEDDIHTRDFLETSFKAESFAVDCASDGEKGSYLARTNDYDLVLLDIGLPKKNGLTVCREIRSAGKVMPILIISVQSEIPDKVTLFHNGADDYLTKPFSYDELIARIRALLRRPPITVNTKIIIDDLTIDSATQTVTRGTEKIYLTRKEFSLLEYLMRNQGTVLSRGMIMEHVWNSDGDPFSNTIEAHIRSVRRKIGPRNKQLIHTIPGRGYKLEVEK